MRSIEARLTQEEKDKRAYDERVKAAKQKEIARVLNETFASSSGRRALRYLMDVCGYQKPSVVADPASGEVQINSTVYNEARRNLYLQIRKYLHPDILIAVENQGLGEDDIETLFT